MAQSAQRPTSVLLLPPRQRLAGQSLPAGLGRLIARADRLPDREAGERAQLLRHFDLLPRGWPVAAITRAFDADDAHLHAWLRADPAHVRPDMTGARVMAIGELGLSREESDALLQPLRPLFGDTGFQISAPVPSRWYLALPPEARLPTFSPPEQVLGDDLFQHLPDGPEGRRWRALLNEAQVLLHNHPVNATRAAAGKPTVNSLCFWGFGKLPDHVRCDMPRVESNDPFVNALTRLATGLDPKAEGALIDLRAARDLALLAEAIEEQVHSLRGQALELDFGDGVGYLIRGGQSWRFWRRAPATLA